MTWYLQLNIAVGLFGLFAIFISVFDISSRQKLKLHILLITLAILVLPFMQLIPEDNYSYFQKEYLQAPIKLATQSISTVNKKLVVSPSSMSSQLDHFPVLILSIILFSLFTLLLKTYRTLIKIQKTFLYKHLGRLKVLISDKKISPYSFSLFNQSYVVLPQFLLNDMEQFNFAVKHEIQHLRNKDTFWVYIFELTVTVCFLNPILYIWRKKFLLDQEFACDEALIAQKKVLPQAYATCLMQIAEITTSHNIPFGATGMAWGKMKPQLLRRVTKMKNIKDQTKTKFNTIVALSLIFFTASVFALNLPTNKITLSELENIVNPMDINDFPIDLNESVLNELNQFLSNSKWRKFAKESLERYKNYEELMSLKSSQYYLPKEIVAIAFIESGFVNLPDRSTSVSSIGAGVWQFIPKTARRFGLEVSKELDERLHIPKATDAAMRYLADNKSKFKDLRLAIMGYYFGEGRVQKDIDRFGTRSPWLLIEKSGYKTPYLARAMAAALLIKYPSLLK